MTEQSRLESGPVDCLRVVSIPAPRTAFILLFT